MKEEDGRRNLAPGSQFVVWNCQESEQPVHSMELLDLGGVRPTAYTIDVSTVSYSQIDWDHASAIVRLIGTARQL